MSTTDHRSRPLMALVLAGWRTSRQDNITRIALATVYVGLVVILAGLYRITPFEMFSTDGRLSFERCVWYMAITELIAIAVWTQYREVREEVLNHQFSGLIVLPVSYYWLKSGDWLGRAAENMVRFVLIGSITAFLITRSFPLDLWTLPFLALSIGLSVLIFNNLHLLVGLTEVWGAHARPMFLIVQKLLFLLGGLLLPLDIYPLWLQKIAWATPFPAILYGPASFALGRDGGEIAVLLLAQALWAIVTGIAAVKLLGAARTKIGRDGD